MLSATTIIPYPHWLNPADNTWQLTAATLVGLMSLPGIAVLYGGLVRKKWIVNTMLMTFAGFSLTLIVWMLWGYNMAFGAASHFGSNGSFWSNFIGHFEPLGDSEFGTRSGRFGSQHFDSLPLPDRDLCVLPVRVRRNHTAALYGCAAWTYQVQGVAVDCAAVDLCCLLRERQAPLGRWLLRHQGRG